MTIGLMGNLKNRLRRASPGKSVGALLLLAVAMWGCFPASGAAWEPSEALLDVVWEYPLPDFSAEAYQRGVEELLLQYERKGGRPLRPAERGSAGIKIYTGHGAGLRTPHNLTRAVIAALERRGFSRENIFIVGRYSQRMRDAGYLKVGDRGTGSFDGVKVYALDSEKFWSADWYYENNLPSRERLAEQIANPQFDFEVDETERYSYLPAPLLLNADFWINLPMASDSEALGVSGALANGTLWAVSNNRRFFGSPANAPVAVVEIAGIPEYRERWALNILTLEEWQFQGGRSYRARYTQKEPRLWMSANANALDYLMYRRISRAKKAARFPVPEEQPPLFDYARTIGVGPYEVEDLKLRRVKPQ